VGVGPLCVKNRSARSHVAKVVRVRYTNQSERSGAMCY
jgi:hypothetical protein